MRTLRLALLSLLVATVCALVAIFWLRGWQTALGFVLGATCSLAAGYIGMMVAVWANVRTATAAIHSPHAALQVAFNGGAVTGLLVVGLALLAVAIGARALFLVPPSAPFPHRLLGWLDQFAG